MEILMRIGAGVLGILFYALLTARDKNDEGTLSVKDYFRNNVVRWTIALLILVVVASFIHVAPEGSALIETATGLAVSTQLASFGTLGYFLVSTARKMGPKMPKG